jgi:hypothetical protein
MRARQGRLLECYGVVSWSDLDIKDIEVASLLSLDSVSSLVKSTQLQDNLVGKQMRSDFKVHSGCDVDSEVVGLEDLLGSEVRRRNFHQREVVVELVKIGLLLLSKSQWEV